jgi:sugar transferase (PEP-CTERM/EpsH1 system associated)
MPGRDANGGQSPLILHVIHHLVTGGMENGLVNLINTMPETRYRHAIACIEDYSSFRERIRRPDVEVYPLYRSRIGTWRLRRELFALCRRLRPAIVHTRNTSGLDALVPAMLAGVAHRVHSEHGWDVGDLRGEQRKPALLRKLHSPFVSHYITVSRDLARYLEKRVGIAPARITPICNGVDTERFHPDALRSGELFTIGTVGRIQPVKDQALLLRAFAAAMESRPELRNRTRVAVVGDGPQLDALRMLAASLGIADLAWLPGAQNDVPRILRSFDLFVLPSLNEGISNTILEALASGLPVVATNVGGNPELVDDGVTGKLFPVGNLEALEQAIIEYATDRALCCRQGEAARDTAIRRFGLTAMVSQYQAVYDRLLARADVVQTSSDASSL